jgi:hypothetical protein
MSNATRSSQNVARAPRWDGVRVRCRADAYRRAQERPGELAAVDRAQCARPRRRPRRAPAGAPRARVTPARPRQIVCLVRQPSRLRLPYSLRSAARQRLRLIVGSLADVDLYADAAREADAAVLLACSWGGADCHAVNVQGTLDVVDRLGPQVPAPPPTHTHTTAPPSPGGTGR